MPRSFQVLPLVGLLCGLMSLGCNSAENLVNNPTFSYMPQFDAYDATFGRASSPLGGVWRLELNAGSAGSLNPVVYEFLAEAQSDGNAISFIVSPDRRSSVYIDLFLDGSELEVKIDEYVPGTNTVVALHGTALLDIGTGMLSGGTYTVRTHDGNGQRDGTGTFDGVVVPPTDSTLELPESGESLRVDFLAVDQFGQGNLEAFGIFDLDFTALGVTGDGQITFRNEENQNVGTGNLTISNGQRDGLAINFNLNGTVNGETVEGYVRLAIVDLVNNDEIGATRVRSGIIRFETGLEGSTLISNRDFGGTLGSSSAINSIS